MYRERTTDGLLDIPEVAEAARVDPAQAQVDLAAIGEELGEPVSLEVDDGGVWHARIGTARGAYWYPGVAIMTALTVRSRAQRPDD